MSPNRIDIKYFALFNSVIRLEFNQSHLDYYTELDAVYLWGMTEENSEGYSPDTSESLHLDTKRTIKLLKELSLTESGTEKPFEAGPNGYFDMLPVSLHSFSAVILKKLGVTADFICLFIIYLFICLDMCKICRKLRHAS